MIIAGSSAEREGGRESAVKMKMKTKKMEKWKKNKHYSFPRSLCLPKNSSERISIYSLHESLSFRSQISHVKKQPADWFITAAKLYSQSSSPHLSRYPCHQNVKPTTRRRPPRAHRQVNPRDPGLSQKRNPFPGRDDDAAGSQGEKLGDRRERQRGGEREAY